jgi:predicted ATPase/DNA-binding XRE family transcriptional regulator
VAVPVRNLQNVTADHGPDLGRVPFDALLRARRHAAGLTQAELAARAGVGVRTVRDLERGRASRPQRTTVELLARALGLTPAERAGFHAAARGRSAPVAGPPAPALPPVVPLVGRDADVAELAALVAEPGGPVTLVGLAGVGKSCLSIAVAHRVAARFPGGVGAVLVTEGSAESDVLTSTASQFGVARVDDLAAHLAAAPALLLLDAVERAPAAVVLALRWLSRSAPTLTVLAAGRHPIEVAGERVWPVAPLEVPPADTGADLDRVTRYPAAALFLTRLRQVRREPLAGDEVGALISLVRRLGGLPLALELAAARGRVLDLNEILHRYGDRVLDLAGATAGSDAAAVTLRDAVAASYRLLEPPERYALRRLSVFRNRWSVELAEALLTDEDAPSGGPLAGDLVPLLDRLLALGLVSVRGTGSTRFRLLDVVRDFAAEQAIVAGELTAARRRHAKVFTRLAARIAPRLTGPGLPDAVAQLDDVMGDLWAALAHAANDDPPTALELAARLAEWWRFRGRDVPGRQWLRRLLDDPRTATVDPAVRAWAEVGVARLAIEHGAAQEELPAAEAALVEFRRAGDVPGELAALSALWSLFLAIGGYDEARQHGEAFLRLARRAGRARDVAVAQVNLAWHDVRAGELAAAQRRLSVVERLAADCGEDRLRAVGRAGHADVARLDGRYDDAEAIGRTALPLLEEIGEVARRRRVLGTIGLALAQAGRLADATEVLAELRAELRAGLRAETAIGEGGSEAGAAPTASPLVGRLFGGGEPAGREADTSGGDGEGACAAIEAHIALRRGERARAAERFAAAARAYAAGSEPRDLAEALVGAAAATEDPAHRAELLDRLGDVCAAGAITLLPAERALLGDEASGRVPRQRQPVERRSPEA